MKTAVIYARYSSDSQTEQSIEGQLRVCEEFAQRNDLVILNTYIDRAMTGTNDNRPAKAPPALSLAHDPPIATANNICRFPIIPHPILSITLDIAWIISASKYIPNNFPMVIIKPAAGITAITTNNALPNFCQKSKDNNFPFFLDLPILIPLFNEEFINSSLCKFYFYVFKILKFLIFPLHNLYPVKPCFIWF